MAKHSRLVEQLLALRTFPASPTWRRPQGAGGHHAGGRVEPAAARRGDPARSDGLRGLRSRTPHAGPRRQIARYWKRSARAIGPRWWTCTSSPWRV